MHPTLQPHAPHAAAPCTPRCNPMHYCVELCHLVITPHRPWPSYPRRWLWVCCQAACSTQHFTACSYRSSSWGCTTRTTGGAPVPLAVSPLLCPPPPLPLLYPLPYPPLHRSVRHSNPYDKYGEDLLDAASHRKLAREAAAQAVVLLGNSHGLLPLRPTQRVAVVGPSANERFSANEHGPWDQDTDLHPI
jgi:hypothetical protein